MLRKTTGTKSVRTTQEALVFDSIALQIPANNGVNRGFKVLPFTYTTSTSMDF